MNGEKMAGARGDAIRMLAQMSGCLVPARAVNGRDLAEETLKSLGSVVGV
jgi:hypothetical protein